MMARLRTLLLSLLVTLVTMLQVNCGTYKCRVTFGNSTCTPSGGGIGGGGGGGGGGTTIDASKASALVYYDSTLQAAGLGGTTFLPLSNYTAPAVTGSADEMVIVNKKFLYLPIGTGVEGFSIDRTTGTLTAIASSPFAAPGGGSADGAWSDPQGRFLFVGDESGTPSIWAYQINAATGALTLSPGSPVTTGFTAADIMTVDASGKFLYAGQNFTASGVAAFSIDQVTGALTQLGGSPFNLGIAQIHASPAAEFLLGVAEIQDSSGSAVDQHVFVYSINPATGVPSLVGAPFLTSAAPFDFAISPNGKFVYTFGTDVTTKLAAPIEGFTMDTTTGALASMGAPFSGLPTSSGCQFEQSGAAMFCVDSLFQSKLFVLGASPTNGALTHVADLTVTSFNFPYAVTD